MWIILGLMAIGFTALNIIFYLIGKDYRFLMVLGLSFTALTLCAEYRLVAEFVAREDWAALQDVVPGMERALWVLTFISIGLNVLPLLLDYRKNRFR